MELILFLFLIKASALEVYLPALQITSQHGKHGFRIDSEELLEVLEWLLHERIFLSTPTCVILYLTLDDH